MKAALFCFLNRHLPTRLIPSLNMIDKRQHATQLARVDHNRGTVYLLNGGPLGKELPAHGPCQFVKFFFHVDLRIDHQASRFLTGIAILHSGFFGVEDEACLGNAVVQASTSEPPVGVRRITNGNGGWEGLLVGRECQVVGVASVGAAPACRQLVQSNIKQMSDHVRYDRRTRAALGQGGLVTCNLCNDRRHLFIQCVVLVLDEETADSTEINTRKEVLKVGVENLSSRSVIYCICLDREALLETVSKNASLLHLKLRLYFELTLRQQLRQPALNKFQPWVGRRNGPRATIFFRHAERRVLIRIWDFVQNES